MINIAFTYQGRKFYIHGQQYDNGRLALIVSPANTDCTPYCILTVNLPKQPLDEGEFFVKVWSENENITNYLRKSGIFEDTLRRVSTGFVNAEVWKFKEEKEEVVDVDPEPLRRR